MVNSPSPVDYNSAQIYSLSLNIIEKDHSQSRKIYAFELDYGLLSINYGPITMD
jgi:hypothetical protein